MLQTESSTDAGASTSVMLPSTVGSDLRVLIVAENASERFGGEAILPLHFFRQLRRRGIEAWMIAHDRTRDELTKLLPEESGRIYYVPDTRLDVFACRVGRYIPSRLNAWTFNYFGRLQGMLTARKLARQLVSELNIDVIHQPIPVSPREPSVLHRMGAPVVMGPMNGGMAFPPAFKALDGLATATVVALGRAASIVINRLIPGKREAEILLVANDRTWQALPKGCRGEVIMLPENGVDLTIWETNDESASGSEGGPTRFLFIGRLVDWKGVDLLLEAFCKVREQTGATLEIVGDGSTRQMLEEQVRTLGLGESVTFSGWLSQSECARRLKDAHALVLPSLYECGGAVVLEAMACGRPVIATKWGGPTDYLDDSCGLLVQPETREQFINDLAVAMIRLAGSPELRAKLSRNGRDRVVREYDWSRKIDRILEIYDQAVARTGRVRRNDFKMYG